MSTSIGPGKPAVTFREGAIELFVAQKADAVGITTNTQRDAFVAALTQGQALEFVKALISSFDFGPPIS